MNKNPFAAASRNNFIIEEILFRSPAGSVYKAKYRFDDKVYVLKERIFPELGKKKNIMNEVNLLGQLNHPNVIHMEGYFVDINCNTLYLVLEWCEGGDLGSKILRRQSKGAYFEETWIWKIFYQICCGLKHLHEHGIVHRDLKTSNIMLSHGGAQAKLADLGVSRQVGTGVEMLNTLQGTPLYLSPELIANQPYNEKTDIWSLGVVLYEMFSLRVPFLGSNMTTLCRSIQQGLSGAQPLPPRYSDTATRFLQWVLQLEPKRRPTIVQVLVRLEQMLITTSTESTRARESNPIVFVPILAPPSVTPPGTTLAGLSRGPSTIPTMAAKTEPDGEAETDDEVSVADTESTVSADSLVGSPAHPGVVPGGTVKEPARHAEAATRIEPAGAMGEQAGGWDKDRGFVSKRRGMAALLSAGESTENLNRRQNSLKSDDLSARGVPWGEGAGRREDDGGQRKDVRVAGARPNTAYVSRTSEVISLQGRNRYPSANPLLQDDGPGENKRVPGSRDIKSTAGQVPSVIRRKDDVMMGADSGKEQISPDLGVVGPEVSRSDGADDSERVDLRRAEVALRRIQGLLARLLRTMTLEGAAVPVSAVVMGAEGVHQQLSSRTSAQVEELRLKYKFIQQAIDTGRASLREAQRLKIEGIFLLGQAAEMNSKVKPNDQETHKKSEPARVSVQVETSSSKTHSRGNGTQFDQNSRQKLFISSPPRAAAVSGPPIGASSPSKIPQPHREHSKPSHSQAKAPIQNEIKPMEQQGVSQQGIGNNNQRQQQSHQEPRNQSARPTSAPAYGRKKVTNYGRPSNFVRYDIITGEPINDLR